MTGIVIAMYLATIAILLALGASKEIMNIVGDRIAFAIAFSAAVDAAIIAACLRILAP